MPDEDLNLRKMAYLAAYGEWGATWRCSSPSPALDPRLADSKRALIGFNSQRPHRELTAEHVADEPGTAPISFTNQQVERASSGLHDIRAAGTLPEDNRIIKAIMRQGGLHPVTAWMNQIACDKAHPILRDLLGGALRAALTAKVCQITGRVKGRRPLGVVEKWRCLIWACVNLVLKRKINRHFTTPLPEDVSEHELRRANAEARVTAAAIEHDAAVGAAPNTASTTRTAAALLAARDALATAMRPFKFVTNWCFAPKGTEKLAFLVRGWCESAPRDGVISDDITAMYQRSSRWNGFSFLRRRFAQLLGIFRFFYYCSPVIWFGGSTVPIDSDGWPTVTPSSAPPTPQGHSAGGRAAARVTVAPPCSAWAHTTRTARTRSAATRGST